LKALGLRIPQILGGGGWEEAEFRQFQELIPRYSGALAFLQTQHQSAGSFLANSPNHTLQQRYLSHFSTGRALMGVGFSQLRRRGKPSITAVEVEGGYLLTGTVPWVTGYNLFANFIVAAVLPDGQAVYGVVPFSEQTTNQGSVGFSPPMPLAAMTSTSTVSATFTNWLLPHLEVVQLTPAEAIRQKDRKNVLNHGFFATGCARAGLDILQRKAQQKKLPFLQETYHILDRELEQCRTKMHQALTFEKQSFERKLELRTWAIDLAGRCAQAAVTSTSGAANLATHPAQRVYREALVFRVSGQTTAVMAATLHNLVRHHWNSI
jgi:alkylation response protein AidB-like acyl-CoA dehydrogenase